MSPDAAELMHWLLAGEQRSKNETSTVTLKHTSEVLQYSWLVVYLFIHDYVLTDAVHVSLKLL